MAGKKQKKSPKKKTESRLKIWHYVLLLAIPLIVFGRAATFGYVMHDDDKMILENPVLKEGFDPGVAFRTDAWFMDARIELYRPWQSISYMIDYALGKENPVIYHVHNLLVYVLGVVFLFVFLGFYFKPILAWAGSMLYAVNLLVPHATGWIAARGDLYLMVFGLAMLILVQRFLTTRNKSFLWVAVPAFFMALLSKESAVALLPVAGIMLYMERKKWPAPVEWLWLGGCAIVFAVYYFMRSPAIADAGNLSPAAFFYNLRSLPEELFKMIIPVGFSVMPGYSLMVTVAGTAVLALLIFIVWKYKPDSRVVWTGLALWLMPLLPSLAYEPSFAGVAYDYLDHRAWLPFAGVWCIILSVVDRSKFVYHPNAAVVFGALLLVWSGVNLWRVGTYENWESYYTNAISTNPGSGLANLNYGSLLRDQGAWTDALPYIQKGVELSPDYTDAKVRLAEAYFHLGRYSEAIEVASQVLAKEPLNVSALQFRGSAMGASGQTEGAIKDFRTILNTEPDNVHAFFNLGVAYKDANQLNLAIDHFSRAISIQPEFPNVYYERGFCYGKLGMFAEARSDMNQSILYQPEHGASYFFRGRAYEALGNFEAACADWIRALQLGTTDAEPFVKARCQG